MDFISAPVPERPQICLITDAIRLDLPSRRDLALTHGVKGHLSVTALIQLGKCACEHFRGCQFSTCVPTRLRLAAFRSAHLVAVHLAQRECTAIPVQLLESRPQPASAHTVDPCLPPPTPDPLGLHHRRSSLIHTPFAYQSAAPPDSHHSCSSSPRPFHPNQLPTNPILATPLGAASFKSLYLKRHIKSLKTKTPPRRGASDTALRVESRTGAAVLVSRWLSVRLSLHHLSPV